MAAKNIVWIFDFQLIGNFHLVGPFIYLVVVRSFGFSSLLIQLIVTLLQSNAK